MSCDWLRAAALDEDRYATFSWRCDLPLRHDGDHHWVPFDTSPVDPEPIEITGNLDIQIQVTGEHRRTYRFPPVVRRYQEEA